MQLYIYLHNKRAGFVGQTAPRIRTKNTLALSSLCVRALFILQDRLEAYYHCAVCRNSSIHCKRRLHVLFIHYLDVRETKDTKERLVILFRTKIALTIKPALVKATHSALYELSVF